MRKFIMMIVLALTAVCGYAQKGRYLSPYDPSASDVIDAYSIPRTIEVGGRMMRLSGIWLTPKTLAPYTISYERMEACMDGDYGRLVDADLQGKYEKGYGSRRYGAIGVAVDSYRDRRTGCYYKFRIRFDGNGGRWLHSYTYRYVVICNAKTAKAELSE